ncbi:hypothetical protein SPHINGOT1_270094 [Sphingomonas sp. T1]|nr:hypothetical protein SPHINGOT1_270094 [Sphingomonas sp. T1]
MSKLPRDGEPDNTCADDNDLNVLHQSLPNTIGLSRIFRRSRIYASFSRACSAPRGATGWRKT